MKHPIPDYPLREVDRAIKKLRKMWARQDLFLNDPALFITWDDPKYKDVIDLLPQIQSKRMVEDAEVDLSLQLERVAKEVDFLKAGSSAIPTLNLLHFGTGVLATAFGSKIILRDGSQPAFEPAVFTPDEVSRLKKPDLYNDGILPEIIKRIDYFNENTHGLIPIVPSDTAGPWTIATQIWNYQSMLEAIYEAPDVVHKFLEMVTECIIEFNDIQLARIGKSFFGCRSNGGQIWFPHGFIIGDDTIVCVSNEHYTEFFRPYNELMAKTLGGAMYHCCMRYDFQFKVIAESKGFIGFDPDPDYNDMELALKYLSQNGVYTRPVIDREVARLFCGKVAFIPQVNGECRQDALEKAAELIAYARSV
jgi:hypothetical protein